MGVESGSELQYLIDSMEISPNSFAESNKEKCNKK